MMQDILCASHGTPGARAAEDQALRLAAPGARIRHLIVVPEFWSGMMGDDWLNNAATRATFGDYLENQLDEELTAEVERFAAKARERNLDFSSIARHGDPAQCLLEVAAQEDCELIVIGAPRPKGTAGFRSRMKLDPLVRGLNAPLFIAPYPETP